MKLIRCYIENFGGLQQYTVDFNAGLTVIHEPNGFGKTTLAEFIRAMFYGFPRARGLAKNPRMKYLPWQGGRYGGYLIFEHDGKRYRIDRTFGDAPKGDRFKLTNEDTRLESHDFTADIGNELFGLDSDSFMRSTYMPQIRDGAPLSTDNIRAKLGNLLEDTGDVGNFDKAMSKLREKRTTYEHFRGSGGRVHDAQRQITALQQQITDCENKQPLLEQINKEIEAARAEQAHNDEVLILIRKQITEATTAEAEAALSREYESLRSHRADTAARLTALQEAYTKGIPTTEDLEAASKRMDDTAALEARLRETPADTAAAQIVAEHEARFGEGVPTEADFTAQGAALDRLVTARSEQRTAALSPAEEAQLQQYTAQFANGIPDDDWFANCGSRLEDYDSCKQLAVGLEPGAEEQQQLNDLHRFFRQGVPDAAVLTDCTDKLEELNKLQHTRQSLQLSTEDSLQLQKLERCFQAGVPTREQLEQQEKKLNRAEQLRRDNLQLSAALPSMQVSEPEPQKKFHSLFLPALILGILAAAAGICLLAIPQTVASIPALFDHHIVIGGICAAVGAIVLITAAFMQNNHSIMNKLQSQTPATGMSAAQRSMMEENERAALALEAEVSAFLADYPAEPDRSLRRRLTDLDTNLALYLPLRERAEKLTAAAEQSDARSQWLTTQLTKHFAPYFATVPDFAEALQTLKQNAARYPELCARMEKRQKAAQENSLRMQQLQNDLLDAVNAYSSPAITDMSKLATALQDLKHSRQRYLELSEKHTAVTARAEALRTEISALEQQLAAFLLPYCGIVAPDSFRQTLNTLRRDADSYVNAVAHVRHRAAALDARDAELAIISAAHEAFCIAYSLSIDLHDRQGLKNIERDADAYLRLQTAMTAADAAFSTFVDTHGHKPSKDVPATSYDLEDLKHTELELIRKQNACRTILVQQEQRSNALRTELDRLPALNDELLRQTEQKAEYTDRRRLLDETMDFMQKARESLATAYLGGVQSHFAKYLNRLTGEEARHIAINTDLEVELERAGSARSMVYFSAGQTDAVHLCMRLALADALFEGQSCFMILDDPFVNLDDVHTEQALALLRELAEDRQIVYLVCNTSRAM